MKHFLSLNHINNHLNIAYTDHHYELSTQIDQLSEQAIDVMYTDKSPELVKLLIEAKTKKPLTLDIRPINKLMSLREDEAALIDGDEHYVSYSQLDVHSHHYNYEADPLDTVSFLIETYKALKKDRFNRFMQEALTSETEIEPLSLHQQREHEVKLRKRRGKYHEDNVKIKRI